MAIELKSPTGKGKVSEKQKHFIERLENNLWTCIVSNNYDYIIVKIVEYVHEIRFGKAPEGLFTFLIPEQDHPEIQTMENTKPSKKRYVYILYDRD